MTRAALLVLTLALCCQCALAADFAGYLTLTSDYVKRGVSQSDGDPAVQLGADLSFENGVFLGAWGSTIDIDNGPNMHRDLETNYYAGVQFDASDRWQLTLNAVAYDYPGQVGRFDYDYQEYSVVGGFDDRLWLEFSYSPDSYGSGESGTNVDVFVEWPVNSIWAIGGGGGFYNTSGRARNSYRYWQLGITGSLKWVDVDLRVHDADRWIPIVSSPDRTDSRLVLTIQFPF